MKPLRFLCPGLALALLLIACGPTAPAAAPTSTPLVSGPSALSLAVASNDFPAGQPRVPFVIFQGTERVADARSVQLTAYELSNGTATPRWNGEAVAYNDYDVPYWVVYPDLSHAGLWGLGAVVTLADGTEMPAQFTIEALADPSAPAIGEVPPASQNRTIEDVPDLGQLTSDPQPEPALYGLTVAQALEADKPAVITFATPGFCESRLCAPVVQSLKAVRSDLGDAASYLHVEVYQDFESFTYVPEMDEWQLTSEPWTFVLDADGKVVARLGGPVSPRELTEHLQPLLER